MTTRTQLHIPVLAVVALGLACLGARQATADYAWLDTEPGEYTLSCDIVRGGGEVRLAFDRVDAETFAYVAVEGGKAALWRVAGGRPERVTHPVPVQTGGDWQASVQRREGRIRLIGARRVLIDAAWPGPITGQVGTLSAADAPLDPLLQPYEPPIVVDDFTREAGETGDWVAHTGTWKNTMVAAPRAEAAKSANPFTVRATAAPTALMTTGSWFWDTYHASVSVRPTGCAAIAIAAYVQDAENMLQFRWRAGAADAPNARELVLVRDGKETVLDAQPGGFAPEHWYRVALNVTPGHVEGLIDRFPAVAADTDALGEGGVGLWCSEGEAVFDDVSVGLSGAIELDLPRLNPVFLADETMTANELYTPAGQWRAGNGVMWNWGDYPYDVRLALPATALGGPINVLLRADGVSEQSGYAVQFVGAAEGLGVTLLRGGQEVATGACPAAEGVVVECRDGAVTVSAGRTEVMRYADPEPLAGRSVGLSGNTDAALMQATVTSDHHHDYAFDSAPTDWFGGKGIWQVTTRWPCQPVWTFFGGSHDENPTLWSKHDYSGDVTLELFANIRMDAPPPPGYTRPSDVNAALCADGRSLGSGYAFVFAGWKNSKSAILRRGEVVAETTDAVFVEPTSSNVNFHRHWFRVRAQKIGGRVSLSVDGREVLAYDDPEPLDGGRVGAWSFHNGLMIGRARLWFGQETPGGVAMPHTEADASPEPGMRAPDGPIADDFETSPAEWQTFGTPATTSLALDRETSAAGNRSLRVTNLTTGGAFGVYASTTPFRAIDRPKLSFDYRLQAGVKVNIYIYSGRQWHAIEFSAEEPDSGDVTRLGKVEGVIADDGWHHGEFDIATPLGALYPESKTLEVKYIAFAAPEESYVRCGIGGNDAGATYWIDNFAIGD